MKVRRVCIKQLYDVYTYEMDFSMGDSIFLITGPNGYGKTTILEILNELSIGRFIYFYTLKFNKIEINFDDNTYLIINKIHDDNREVDDTSIDTYNKTVFEYYNSNNEMSADYQLDYANLHEETRNYTALPLGDDSYINDYFRNWNPTSKHIFINKSDTKLERIEKTVDLYPGIYEEIAKKNKQEQFLLLIKRFKCSYIPAERLMNFRDNSNERTIETVKSRIDEMLHNEYKNYLEKAQDYDKKMLDKLINSDINPFNKEEYNDQAKYIRNYVDVFSKFGIGNVLEIHDFRKEKAEILTMHIKNMHDKIDVLYPFLKKLSIFADCLEKKKFSNKIIKIDFNRGLTFVARESNEIIPVTKLSSGEKNEIILLFNLIFKVKNNSILLIDEPENSLHVAWQAEFFNDIETIAKTNGVQVIIATHSPTIIGGRWNRTFDLYRENRERKV